jgi:hypothetical protein
VVVVVEEVIGDGCTVVSSVVVVLLTLSELPQPATMVVQASSAQAIKSRKPGVVRGMR